MVTKKSELSICSECKRLHTQDQPCPLRVANALMMQPQGLESLTDADRKWMAEHPFSVVELVEGTVASMM